GAGTGVTSATSRPLAGSRARLREDKTTRGGDKENAPVGLRSLLLPVSPSPCLLAWWSNALQGLPPFRFPANLLDGVFLRILQQLGQHGLAQVEVEDVHQAQQITADVGD